MTTSIKGKPPKRTLAVGYLVPAALLARSMPVKSPLDGRTIWAVRPHSDEELWRRVGDLTDDEFRRVCALWKRRREDPWLTVPELRAAHETIRRLITAPARLQKRRGQHRSRLGGTPVAIELTRQFLKRLHDVTRQTLSDTKRGKPNSRDVARRVLSGLTQRCRIRTGPLQDQIVRWNRRHMEVLKKRLHDYVCDARQQRSNRSRATDIVLSFLTDLDPDRDPLSVRHLDRIFKHTTSPEPIQDAFRPPRV